MKNHIRGHEGVSTCQCLLTFLAALIISMKFNKKFLPSSDDEDSVDTWGLKVEASNLGAVGLCLRAGFQ